eukprot:SM000189S04079  [mRNA]  locus=s189:140813:141817:+ [translate_table: standard]
MVEADAVAADRFATASMAAGREDGERSTVVLVAAKEEPAETRDVVQDEIQADLDSIAAQLQLPEGVQECLNGMNLMRCPSLSLNYEDVLSTWADQIYWSDGRVPQNLAENSSVSDSMLSMDDKEVPDRSFSDGHVPKLEAAEIGLAIERLRSGPVAGHVAEEGVVEDREARVNRYKEKRRTRLYHKKIRYHVRKLNAERRPRIKGRFIKRDSGAPV